MLYGINWSLWIVRLDGNLPSQNVTVKGKQMAKSHQIQLSRFVLRENQPSASLLLPGSFPGLRSIAATVGSRSVYVPAVVAKFWVLFEQTGRQFSVHPPKSP